MSTKRSIPFEFFAQNQFMYFDLGRLAALEREAGAPVITIMMETESAMCGIGFLIAACRAGLAHHYSTKPGIIEDVIDKYIEDGGTIFDPNILSAISRAMIASGILGKELADKAVRDELAEIKAEETEGKNDQTPASE